MQKSVNGVIVTLTAEEEARVIARKEQEVIEVQEMQEAEAQKITDKEAGNQKLLNLGLSQAEVDALIN